MNELIERLREMACYTYQSHTLHAPIVMHEAADTLLALQTQLERVERETIERCAKVANDWPFNSKEERNAYRWSDTGKAMAWDIALAIKALPSAKTETE